MHCRERERNAWCIGSEIRLKPLSAHAGLRARVPSVELVEAPRKLENTLVKVYTLHEGVDHARIS